MLSYLLKPFLLADQKKKKKKKKKIASIIT